MKKTFLLTVDRQEFDEAIGKDRHICVFVYDNGMNCEIKAAGRLFTSNRTVGCCTNCKNQRFDCELVEQMICFALNDYTVRFGDIASHSDKVTVMVGITENGDMLCDYRESFSPKCVADFASNWIQCASKEIAKSVANSFGTGYADCIINLRKSNENIQGLVEKINGDEKINGETKNLDAQKTEVQSGIAECDTELCENPYASECRSTDRRFENVMFPYLNGKKCDKSFELLYDIYRRSMPVAASGVKLAYCCPIRDFNISCNSHNSHNCEKCVLNYNNVMALGKYLEENGIRDVKLDDKLILLHKVNTMCGDNEESYKSYVDSVFDGFYDVINIIVPIAYGDSSVEVISAPSSKSNLKGSILNASLFVHYVNVGCNTMGSKHAIVLFKDYEKYVKPQFDGLNNAVHLFVPVHDRSTTIERLV